MKRIVAIELKVPDAPPPFTPFFIKEFPLLDETPTDGSFLYLGVADHFGRYKVIETCVFPEKGHVLVIVNNLDQIFIEEDLPQLLSRDKSWKNKDCLELFPI